MDCGSAWKGKEFAVTKQLSISGDSYFLPARGDSTLCPDEVGIEYFMKFISADGYSYSHVGRIRRSSCGKTDHQQDSVWLYGTVVSFMLQFGLDGIDP